MKTKDLKTSIKKMGERELAAFVREKREALRQGRFNAAGSRGRDVKKAREDRKAIARALTELGSRAAK